jgi:hypothetical protein
VRGPVPVAVPAARWPAPREHPTTYPGAAPGHAYLLVGDHVRPLEVVAAGDALAGRLPDGTDLDLMLGQLGATPLAERIPVLAYGANRGPQSLLVKFAHHPHGGLDAPGFDVPAADAPPVAPPPVGATVVPVLRATVHGHDVVAAGMSLQGFVFADLVPSAGTAVEVMITLLDPDQAAAVHDSEGVGAGRYDLVALPGGAEVTGTGRWLDVLAYACCRKAFLSPEVGSPLALATIEATGRALPALDQVALLAHVLRTTGLVPAVAELAEPEVVAARAAARAAGAAGAAGADGAAGPADEATVARALSTLLSAQWWRQHRTGERPVRRADQALSLVRAAMATHSVARSTAARLADAGAVLSVEEAYGAGPHLRLAARPLR